MKKTRILIADDHEIVRRGLRTLIASEGEWEVCGEAAYGCETVAKAGALRPDVIVLDVNMPGISGVEATRQIKQLQPEVEVLAFTGFDSEDTLHQVFAAGALACVFKSDAGEQLIPAIKALCLHQPYLANRASRVVFDSYLHGGLAATHTVPGGLSGREREIVRLLAHGESNKEVAGTLGISVKTVDTHRAAIMKKLGFISFSELVRFAIRHQLVAP